MPAARTGAGRAGTGGRQGTVPLPQSAQPLHARLRERLRDEILKGQRAAHDRLPSEAELTAAYGVSRITVRQALAALHADGLILRVQGKGSFVAPPRVSPDQSRVQGLAEALGDGAQELHARVLSFDDVRAPPAAAAGLGVEPGTVVSELLSLRYMNRQPLSLNRSWFETSLGARLRRADIAGRDVLSICERDFGIAIGRADVVVGAALADRLQRRHLQLPDPSPVLVVDRVVHRADGTPLQVESSCYRSDAFSYRVSLAR